MICGLCDKTDGMCYTSNPPKVKCTLTGKFHLYDDSCDAIEYTLPKVSIATNCLICGEPVVLTSNEETALLHNHKINKICDKCRAAVMRIRNEMET